MILIDSRAFIIAATAIALIAWPTARAQETAKPPAEAAPAAAPDPAKLPNVNVNIEQKYIDLSGEVCLNDGLLELVVTVRSAKEHESVFTVKARPQHIHLALLMLGLKPGAPGSWRYEDRKPIPIDPKGDRVAAFAVFRDKDGKEVETPINQFVKDRVSGKTLDSHVFLFAGSKLVDPPMGERFYMADQTGDVVSLVSFDAELLAIPRAASSANDDLIWVANREKLPEVGTPVTIRLRSAEPATETSK